MKVFQHADPGSLGVRSHPWTRSAADPACIYVDFVAEPERIRSEIEDLDGWDPSGPAETFYGLLQWLAEAGGSLESNDCALCAPAASGEPEARWQCSGRLMVLFRDLRANTRPAEVEAFVQAVARTLDRVDPDFEGAAIGLTAVPVRFLALPEPERAGQQVLLSFWAWGDDERETLANLDRALVNLWSALQRAA